jgi:hypothetical protein
MGTISSPSSGTLKLVPNSRAEAPIHQQRQNQNIHVAEEEEEIVLPKNKILTIYNGTTTPASKTKLKQVKRQLNST